MITLTQNGQYFVWVGAGWYAARHVGEETHYHFVGNDKANAPDTHSMGLGAPVWFDSISEAKAH